MPVTITELFAACGLSVSGPVRWSEPVPNNGPGVYVIAITRDPDACLWHSDPPVPLPICAQWMISLNPPTIKSKAPLDARSLQHLLSNLWYPFETVLYVGKAGSSFATRVVQFYVHRLGDKGPHAGGQRLLTLSILFDLWVFWGNSPNPDDSERCMFDHFKEAIPALPKPVAFGGPEDVKIRPFANEM